MQLFRRVGFSPEAAHELLMREDASRVLTPSERDRISRIAAAHGALNVRLFGSVRRGESNSASDLDLLVDLVEGRTLFDLIALGDELEEALGIEVDVVTEKSLSLYLRDKILAEAVALSADKTSRQKS